MKRIIFFLASLLLASNALLAQNIRVSQPLSDALGSGKYYMRLKMQSLDFGDKDDAESAAQMENIMSRMETEMACKGSSAMMRMNMGGVSMATLYANGQAYRLDEDARTYETMRGPSGAPGAMKLTFRRQGECKVNGQPYYYDEYTFEGAPVTFYYNNARVAIIDLGPGRGGAMALLAFSAWIPDHMYFCLDSRWKGTGSPAPPKCATPWKDNTKFEELACGESLRTPFQITDKHGIKEPVWLSQFGTSAPAVKPRTGAYTIEGVEEALAEIAKKLEGQCDEQVERNVIDAGTKDMAAVVAGKVTPDLTENAIARALLCPHPIALNDAAALLICGGSYDEATVLLEEAIKEDPKNPFIVANLAECYLEKKNPRKAQLVIENVIAECPRGELHSLLAMSLLAQDEFYKAIDEFCVALSYGFCDNIMASYFWNTIAAMREGVADEDLHSMAIQTLNRIYTEENRVLLRQAVMRDAEECFNDAGTFDFSWTFTPESIEPMYKSLGENADAVRKILADYEDKFKSAQLRSNAWRMCSSEFDRLEALEGVKSNGDLTYSARFWALWMLEAYHLLNLEYVDEQYTYYPEGNINQPREGWCPKEFTARDAFILRTNDDIFHRIKDNNEQKEAAEKNINSPLALARLEYEYTQREFDITKQGHQAIVSRELEYYNKFLKPAMEDYWETINDLVPYINDQSSRNYFVYRAKYEILSRYRESYQTGAYHGSMISNVRYTLDYTREMYIVYLKEANQQKEAERLERLAKVEEAKARLQEMKDTGEEPLKNFKKGFQIPDFSISVGDQDIHAATTTVGIRDGHFFYERRDNKTGVTQGTLFGVGDYTRVVDTYYVNGRAGQQRQWEQNKAALDRQSIGQKLAGKIPVVGNYADYASGAVNNTYSSPINFNNQNEYTFQYDSKGNLLRVGERMTSTVSSNLMGSISGTSVTDRTRHYGGAVTGSVVHRHNYITVSPAKIFKINIDGGRLR